MFPLLLLSTTILGYVLSGNPDLQHRILTSALSEFPIVGNQLQEPSRIGSGATGLVIGVLGALYGGLGVAQAVQYAMNTAWRILRNNRPNPIKARGCSLLLLGTAGTPRPLWTVFAHVKRDARRSWDGQVFRPVRWSCPDSFAPHGV